MQDFRDAHDVLGVRKDATRDDIIQRYNLLLKKHRINKVEESSSLKSEMEQINLAYSKLMGYTGEEQLEKQTEFVPNFLLKRLGIDEKKARNFFYYYKFHLIIGVIVLLIAVFTVKDFSTKVTPDLNVVFIGEFSGGDNEMIQQKIQNKFSKSSAASVEILPISKNSNSQQEYAIRMKMMAIMAAGGTDVFILDKSNFLDLGKRGAFMSLDEYVTNKKERQFLKFQTDDGNTEHVYGVDITSNEILKDFNLSGKEFIAAIGIKPQHPDRAVQFLKLMLE